MKRLFIILSAISALLLVAVLLLWLLSQRHGYALIFFNGATTDYAASSQRNWIAFGTHPRSPYRPPALLAADIPLGSAFPRHRAIAIPHAALAAALAILPALQSHHKRRQTIARTRALTGLCPSCGYDLRASPDRCSECGATPIQTPA